MISLSPILSLNVRAQTDEAQIIVLTADGPITPAMAQYLSRGIKTAESQGAEALIFQLNTPGGSVDTMNEMEQMMLGSNVPIIVYVAPKGAMAASAGTIITLAGHASSMWMDFLSASTGSQLHCKRLMPALRTSASPSLNNYYSS